MRRGRAWGAFAAATALVAGITVLAAAPAGASVPPSISIDSPGGGEVLTANPTISGTASMPGGLDRVGTVTVRLVSSRDTPDPCDPCNGNDHGSEVSFSWSPELAYNGSYQARVHATGSQFLFGVLDGEAGADRAVSFQMEAPPVQPGGVRATTNSDRSVTVSWVGNPEPDMLGYRVQRKDPGGSTFQDIAGPVKHPGAGAPASVTDPTAAQGTGTFVYRVQAIRVGRSGDSSTAVASGFVPADAVVPALPGAGPPSDPSAAIAAPGEGAAPTRNLSSFLRGGGAPPSARLPGAPAIPDGTYQEALPFGLPPALSSDDLNEVALEAGSSEKGGRALLVPIAGGILLFVVAFHVRRFNGWLAADGDPGRASPRTDAALLEPATNDSGADFEALPAPASGWLSAATEPESVVGNGSSVTPFEASPGFRIISDGDPEGRASFDDWLNGSDPSPVKPEAEPDGADDIWAERGHPEDKAVPEHDHWEEIFAVKSGAGRTRTT